MKKNLKENSNIWNYKLQRKLPTKKEEKDFMDNLTLRQKEYKVFDLKPIEKFNKGNWDNKTYFTLWERIVRKLLKKDYLDL